MSEITEVNETTRIKAKYDERTNEHQLDLQMNSEKGVENTMIIPNKLVEANDTD